MKKNLPFANEDDMRRALRQEALEGGPEFSPALHERILARVRTAGEGGGGAGRGGWRIGWWLAAAAACVAVAGGLWYVGRPEAPVREVEAPAASLEPLVAVQDIVRDAVDPAKARLEEGKFAYLDRDAERFAQFVYDQVAVAPTEQ